METYSSVIGTCRFTVNVCLNYKSRLAHQWLILVVSLLHLISSTTTSNPGEYQAYNQYSVTTPKVKAKAKDKATTPKPRPKSRMSDNATAVI